MIQWRRERWLAVGGVLGGLLGGQAIVWAGLGGRNLWLILIVVLPPLLCVLGARRMSTFAATGISLMTPVQLHAVLFGVRSGYYTAYGIRWDDVVNTTILWGGTVGCSLLIGLVSRHLAAPAVGDHPTREG